MTHTGPGVLAALILGACLTAAVPETAASPAEPEVLARTFAGDCTLGCDLGMEDTEDSFQNTVGEDYGYPFRNVAAYVSQDEFTLANLGMTLCEDGSVMPRNFNFRGPTAYSAILTEGSVEAVSVANNHTYDYGKEGYAATLQALTEAGIAYVERDKGTLVTTKNGLVIGLYGATYQGLDEKAIVEGIGQLKEQGADIVIFAPHWGQEMSYRLAWHQQTLGRAAIDAGADIVFGTHPHVLLPVEDYRDGMILYSLGNFSFGGHFNPADYDTALIQVEVLRYPDGTVTLGRRAAIPASISSQTDRNNYQPTPYAPDSEDYRRVLAKLDGSWQGK